MSRLDMLWKKMGMSQAAYFLDLARMAIAEAIDSPARGREMVDRDHRRHVPGLLRAAALAAAS